MRERTKAAQRASTPVTEYQGARHPRRETMFSKIDEEDESEVERLSFKYDGAGIHTDSQREQMRKSILISPRGANESSRPVADKSPPMPPMHKRRFTEYNPTNVPSQPTAIQMHTPVFEGFPAVKEVYENASGAANVNKGPIETSTNQLSTNQQSTNQLSTGYPNSTREVHSSTNLSYTGYPLFQRPPPGSVPPPPQYNPIPNVSNLFGNAPPPQGGVPASGPNNNVPQTPVHPPSGDGPSPSTSQYPYRYPPPKPHQFNPFAPPTPQGFEAGSTAWNGGFPQYNPMNVPGTGYHSGNGKGANVPNQFYNPINPNRGRPNGDMGMLDKISDAITNPLHGTYMTQVLPSYEKIELKHLDPRSVIQYVESAYNYTSQHNVAFKLTSQITPTVRDCIIDRNAAYLDSYNFHHLDNRQMVKVLQYTTRPISIPEFIENMKKFVPFKLVGDPGYENFQNFYDALSRYKRRWIFYYEFMAENNEENTPHCNFRKDGSINMFLSEIPAGYGQNRANVLRETKFSNIMRFIECFWIEVEHDYERSRSHKILQRGFDKVPSQTPSKEDSKRSTTPPKSKPLFFPRKSSVSQLGTAEVGTSENDDVQEQVHPGEEYIDESTIYDLNDFAEDDREAIILDTDPTQDEDYDRKEDPDRVPGQLAAVQPRPQDKYNGKPKELSSTKPKVPYEPRQIKTSDKPVQRRGCFNALKKEGCVKPDCKFSHDPEDLKRTLLELQQVTQYASAKYGTHRKPDERKAGGDHGFGGN
jgi:hypothetical protein